MFYIDQIALQILMLSSGGLQILQIRLSILVIVKSIPRHAHCSDGGHVSYFAKKLSIANAVKILTANGRSVCERWKASPEWWEGHRV